ncbi:helicase superfamily protein [Calothrix sp. NIES-4071]|nr:helicase superfamily protein [Calothrix sp. NIES-4071]BAZ60840.1 helicase superfamily protein [Calothrix sp. NIES-4105]
MNTTLLKQPHGTNLDLTTRYSSITLLPLNSTDLYDLTVKRGLDPNWVVANVRRISKADASELLGYPAPSGGLLIMSADGSFQFKPDEPWINEETGKVVKYLTMSAKKGDYGAILPINPVKEDDYWSDDAKLLAACRIVNGRKRIGITEGGFKAQRGCSIGIPYIGILGVTMGMTGSKNGTVLRYLLESIKRPIRLGIDVVITFDADLAKNENVQRALRKLANEMYKDIDAIKSDSRVYLVKLPLGGLTGMDESIKGMDDFIKAHGADEFYNLFDNAELIERLETNLEKTTSLSQIKKPIPLGKALAEKYKGNYLYHAQQQMWRKYNGKIWEMISGDVFESEVFNDLDKITNLETEAQINGAKRALKNILIEREWVQLNQQENIAFNNGIYNLVKQNLKDFEPGDRLLSHLPYDYEKVEIKGSVIDALREYCPEHYETYKRIKNGNERGIWELLAIINAIITGLFQENQKFLYIEGEPATGKGTYVDMLMEIVGRDNKYSTEVRNLGNLNTRAELIDKKLLICPDERKKVLVDDVLKIVASDYIECKRLYSQPFSLPFKGALVVVANNYIFNGDATGIDRRIKKVNFLNPVPASQRSENYKQLLKTEIPKLVSIALQLDPSEVDAFIKADDNEVPNKFSVEGWLELIKTDSVAKFIDERVRRVEGAKFKTRIGRVTSKTTSFDTTKIVEAFADFCQVNDLYPGKFDEVADRFIEITAGYLGWDVIKDRDSQGNFIGGEVRLRDNHIDYDVPTHSELFEIGLLNKSTQSTQSIQDKDYRSTQGSTQGVHDVDLTPTQQYVDEPIEPTLTKQPNVDLKSTQCRPNVDPNVDLKPLPDKDNVDYVDLNESNLNNSIKGGASSISSKGLNVGSIVKCKDKRYPEIYRVVGGGNGKWQCEPISLTRKLTNADSQTFTTNQLELYEMPF